MKRWLQYRGRRAMQSLGYAGIAALLLLVPSSVIVFSLPRLKLRTQELHAAVETTRALRDARPSARTVSNGERATGFIAGFPTRAQSGADIDTIFQIASRNHLTLLKGEYQLKAEPRASFVSYTATFPMHSDYATLKRFTVDVLTALPHVSLDELRMTRAAAGDSTLDATVRFTMNYRST